MGRINGVVAQDNTHISYLATYGGRLSGVAHMIAVHIFVARL